MTENAHEQLIAMHRKALALLGCKPLEGVEEAIGLFDRGELLDSQDAGNVLGRTSSTANRLANSTFEEGSPIAFKFGELWIFVKSWLLDHIERKSSLSRRREAETRFRKMRETRVRAQKSRPNAGGRAGAFDDACDIAIGRAAVRPDMIGEKPTDGHLLEESQAPKY